MTRRGRSLESQIAREVLGTMLKSGRRRGRRQKGGCYSFGVVLFIIIALIGSCTNKNDRESNRKNDATRQVEVAPRYEYGGASASVAVDDQDEAFKSPVSTDDEYSQDESPSADVVNKQTETASYAPTATSSSAVPNGERVKIERCVDGDTFIVITSTGERQRVRLIGANTPETVKKNWPVEPFGPEASAYTKRRVAETGNVATLVSDGDAFDRYNRRLAFVYLGDEEISLNEDLCRQGLAKAETKYRFSREMKERLTNAADAAKREGLGIYSL